MEKEIKERKIKLSNTLQTEFSINVLPFAELPRNRNAGIFTWKLALSNIGCSEILQPE